MDVGLELMHICYFKCTKWEPSGYFVGIYVLIFLNGEKW